VRTTDEHFFWEPAPDGPFETNPRWIADPSGGFADRHPKDVRETLSDVVPSEPQHRWEENTHTPCAVRAQRNREALGDALGVQLVLQWPEKSLPSRIGQ
jgi:hypothetical protein